MESFSRRTTTPLRPSWAQAAGELAAVIGLDDCAHYGGIAALGRALGEGEFEVAGFVAAKGEAGQIVALDPYLRPSECGRQPRTVL